MMAADDRLLLQDELLLLIQGAAGFAHVSVVSLMYDLAYSCRMSLWEQYNTDPVIRGHTECVCNNVASCIA